MDPVASLIAIVLIAGFLVQLAITPSIFRRRQRARLIESFGRRPASEALDELDMAAARTYCDLKREFAPPASDVDDITGSDLDLDQVFMRLNRTQSDVGEQLLYAMLRDTGVPSEAIARRAEIQRLFMADEALRTDVMMPLSALGKRRHHGSAEYLFRPEVKMPGRAWTFVALAVAPLAVALTGIAWPPLLLVAALLLGVNAVVYYRTAKRWRAEIAAVAHLCGVVRCARALAKLDIPALAPELQALRESLPALRPMMSWAQRFNMSPDGPLGFLVEYVKILFQMDMISLNRITANLVANTAQMKCVYEVVGELDALTSAAWVRAEQPGWCEATFHDERRVAARDVAHPLIARPVPNSIDWDENVLITGSNASGKSTFTKSMAIAAITAQSLGIAFASSLAMPRARVLSSMAIRDDVLRGESYFVAEVRSLKRILDAADGGTTALCFIDEILRGTNAAERIAASTALLDHLRGRNALVMAATHDIELTRTLGYRNVHFRETLTEEGMAFTYQLMDGPSQTRNAIRLMRQMGFPSAVVEDAEARIAMD